MPESWNNCQGELRKGHRSRWRERSMLQSAKMKGFRVLKSMLSSGMEMQSFKSELLVFHLALYFLTMLPFLSSLWEWWCIFCAILHWKYVICFWILQASLVKRVKETLNFVLLKSVKTLINYGDFWSWTGYSFTLLPAHQGLGKQCGFLIKNAPKISNIWMLDHYGMTLPERD